MIDSVRPTETRRESEAEKGREIERVVGIERRNEAEKETETERGKEIEIETGVMRRASQGIGLVHAHAHLDVVHAHAHAPPPPLATTRMAVIRYLGLIVAVASLDHHQGYFIRVFLLK